MFAPTNQIVPVLVRRYIAWTERNVAQRCVELHLDDLQRWDGPLNGAPPAEIVPLPQCGSEWLLPRLHRECSADCPGYRPAGRVHMIALRAAPYHDPHGIFVARVEARGVGFCIARNRPGGRGLINGLAVHPEFRGQGIGRALLGTGLLYLRRKGATEATIRVHPDNVPAVCLYRSVGFSRRAVAARPGA